MTALDTNVLVRYLVRDDLKQAHRARSLIERLDKNQEQAYVSDIVLCELVWVLRSRYGADREQLALLLGQLVSAKQLRFDSTDRVLRALRAYQAGKGDFSDYLIREQARNAGCTTIATFDQRLLKEDLFAAP